MVDSLWLSRTRHGDFAHWLDGGANLRLLLKLKYMWLLHVCCCASAAAALLLKHLLQHISKTK
jgi:hypothetical protein